MVQVCGYCLANTDSICTGPVHPNAQFLFSKMRYFSCEMEPDCCSLAGHENVYTLKVAAVIASDTADQDPAGVQFVSRDRPHTAFQMMNYLKHSKKKRD